mmetsp:Transcript_69024/g.173922  ORF Transcript_69024/g.173922 Transcript_69024/m.173922 type:complete len:320 (+) Transcript_69024:423-1382(+)
MHPLPVLPTLGLTGLPHPNLLGPSRSRSVGLLHSNRPQAKGIDVRWFWPVAGLVDDRAPQSPLCVVPERESGLPADGPPTRPTRCNGLAIDLSLTVITGSRYPNAPAEDARGQPVADATEPSSAGSVGGPGCLVSTPSTPSRDPKAMASPLPKAAERKPSAPGTEESRWCKQSAKRPLRPMQSLQMHSSTPTERNQEPVAENMQPLMPDLSQRRSWTCCSRIQPWQFHNLSIWSAPHDTSLRSYGADRGEAAKPSTESTCPLKVFSSAKEPAFQTCNCPLVKPQTMLLPQAVKTSMVGLPLCIKDRARRGATLSAHPSL